VVSTRLGIQATIFYLAGYVLMNMAAFAVIVARERETETGDDISSLYGLGADRPLLAWPMTIAMLSLAGFPATVGFFGKLYLIQAAVDNEYAWLGVAIVVGSAISLVYYLRVIAAVWMRPASDAAPVGHVPGARPAMAGGSQEADAEESSSVPARRHDTTVDSLSVDDGDDADERGRRLRQPEVVFVAVLCGLATVAFGVWPDPLFELARDAGASIASLV
jgi:NADH-quinone oxidoreductase subunit N